MMPLTMPVAPSGSPPLLPTTVLVFRAAYAILPITFGVLLFLSVFGWTLARVYRGNTRPWRIATIISAVCLVLAVVALAIAVATSQTPYIHF